MSPELALYEQLKAAIDAASGDSPLAGSILHETVYEPIASMKGIRIGDSVADVGPRAGEFKEFNVVLPLQIFRRVDGLDFTTAREDLRELALKVAGIIISDSSLGGRVCDVRILNRGRRGWARIQTTPYAVQVYMILIDAFGFKGE